MTRPIDIPRKDWNARHRGMYELLDDEYKKKYVQLVWWLRNQRTCRNCGRQWCPDEDKPGRLACIECGSRKIRKRIK